MWMRNSRFGRKWAPDFLDVVKKTLIHFVSRKTTTLISGLIDLINYKIQGGARNVIPLIVHVTHFYYYKSI